MKLKFTKMQGCGNDYIYIDCFEQTVTDYEKIAVTLSDRHFGVGGDGVIFICPSKVADCKMRMFNLDGSEGDMCGNGIRCVGKYMYERRGSDRENLTVETKSGIKNLSLKAENRTVSLVSVNMGIPKFYPDENKITINDTVYGITCVSMGNPHCVIFVDDVKNTNVKALGNVINSSPLFPDGVNIEFVQVKNDKEIKMRVFERGSEETLSCGTGACAVVAVLEKLKRVPKNETVTVELLGGHLDVTCLDNGIILTGDAEFVFDGEVDFNGENKL